MEENVPERLLSEVEDFHLSEQSKAKLVLVAKAFQLSLDESIDMAMMAIAFYEENARKLKMYEFAHLK